jgi:hypothetical protein
VEIQDGKFACEACGKRYPRKPQLAGNKCACGAVIVVPQAAAPRRADDDRKGGHIAQTFGSTRYSRSDFVRRGARLVGAAAVLGSFPTAAAAEPSAATTTVTSNASPANSVPTTTTSAQTYDLRDFVRWIVEEFEPSVRLPGPAGSYARLVGGTEVELYGASDMACVLYTIGRLSPTETERREWAAVLQSFQNPDTGYLLEKSRTHTPLHNTAFALGAMQLLEVRAKHPLKFAAEYADVAAFLGTLDWQKRVYSDSHRGAGVASVYALAPELRSTAWFDAFFRTCDAAFDPANGLMGHGKPPGGDSDQIGGTFHYHFLYEHFNRRMPFPQKRIDSVIGLQQPDGYWHPTNHLWLTLDAIYLMTRTLRYTAYRAGDVVRVVQRCMDVLMNDFYGADGRERFARDKMGVHSLTSAISIAAEAQQFLGADRVVTDWPLHLVLDRRPFI